MLSVIPVTTSPRQTMQDLKRDPAKPPRHAVIIHTKLQGPLPKGIATAESSNATLKSQ